MSGQQLAPMAVGFAAAVVMFLLIGYFWKRKNMIAHLAPVKRELKKEKQWLRRGEYNAAMVKGRQNLELFLKLVAEFNGIYLDNSAQAMANAKSGPDGRGQRESFRMNGRKRQRVMTFQQFGWWLDENGYLDRVGKWELNEIRVIGNKAVHENYVSKEDAWNQYNYMEDLLKIVSDRHTNRHRQRGPEIRMSQAKYHGADAKKPQGRSQTANRGQNQPQRRNQTANRGQNQSQGRNQTANRGQNQSQGRNQTANRGQNQSQGRNQTANRGQQNQPQKRSQTQNHGQTKRDGGKKSQNGKPGEAAKEIEQVQPERKPRSIVTVQPASTVQAQEYKPAVSGNVKQAESEKISASAKRRQRRKRAKAAREAAESVQTEKTEAPAKKMTEQPVRKSQPSSSVKIVTLSPAAGNKTAGTEKPAAKKNAGRQELRNRASERQPASKHKTQNTGTAKPMQQNANAKRQQKNTKKIIRTRRNLNSRPAGKTAAGGGKHEES